MRRILTAVLASSLLALALPVAASAHHGSRHDAAKGAQARKHHRRHHAHMVVFAPKAAPSGTTTSGTSGTETPAPPTEPVATVASFEGGILKITLPDNSTVSGKVTEATEIECGCEHQGSPGEQQGFGHDGSGDFGHESGSGDSSPGAFQHDDEQGQQSGTESSCGTASLVPGAKIKEAELNVSSAGAVWDKIELLPKS